MDKPIRGSILVGLLAAPLLFLGTTAQGMDGSPRTSSGGGNPNLVYACVRKGDGYVRIVGPRDRCHRWERALTWVREVPPPAPAPTPGPGPSGSGVEVVDSAGTVLGPVVSMNMGFPVVALRTASNVVFTLTVSSNGFQSPDAVFYGGDQCTGTPYLIPTGSPVAAAAVDAQGRVLVDDGSTAPGPVNLATYFDPGMGMCFTFGSTASAVPGTFVLEAGNFQRPFKVR